MKIKQIILATTLAFGLTPCFGQTDQTKTESASIQLKSKPGSPFYVLTVDEKNLELDARKNEHVDLATIDPNTIESIQILKGREAKDKYGDKGQNGVVIITFKDFNLLSKELQAKFTDLSKK